MKTIEVEGMLADPAREAHARTVQETVDDVARFLFEVLGTRLTASLAGVRDPHQVRNWISGKNAPQPKVERRLRAAYQVFQLLQSVESPHVVRAWFIGMNPQLDDESPIDALAADRLREVMAAATAFVAGG
jgi:hypothetical protein